jgi:uncharacterized protein
MITDMLCDASVVVPLVVPEPTTHMILNMMDIMSRPLVSDFVVGEVCSAISIRVRRREIDAAEGARILTVLDLWLDRNATRVTTEADDIALAERFVRRFDLGLRMPDALHLAAAHRLSMPVFTQDRRQSAAARSLGLEVIEPPSSPAG